MDRQVFDDAIGASPPSAVDVEAIIARERRAERFRWATNPGVAAGGAVLAVVIGVAVAVLPGHAGDSGVTLAGPTSSGSTAPPSTTPSPCDKVPRTRQPPTAPNTSENPDTAGTRLTGVLAGLIHTQSPDLRLSYPSGVPDEPHGPLSFQHIVSSEIEVVPNIPGTRVSIAPHGTTTLAPAIACSGPTDFFITYVNATDAMGTGSLSVVVARRGGANEPLTDCTKLSGICNRSTGPNGEIIVTVTEAGGRGKSNSVSVSKPDGTAVSLHADNVPDSLKSANKVGRTTPPLTLNQLVAIATDPGMTLYPH